MINVRKTQNTIFHSGGISLLSSLQMFEFSLTGGFSSMNWPFSLQPLRFRSELWGGHSKNLFQAFRGRLGCFFFLWQTWDGPLWSFCSAAQLSHDAIFLCVFLTVEWGLQFFCDLLEESVKSSRRIFGIPVSSCEGSSLVPVVTICRWRLSLWYTGVSERFHVFLQLWL